MVEIIPSINEKTFAGVEKKMKQVEPYVSWCHLDVTDGVFSSHETWRDAQDLKQLNTHLNAEVHLMIQEPEGIIGQWLVSPIRRVIVHIEAMRDPELIIQKCRAVGVEVGFALNPDTPISQVADWLKKIDIALVLAVTPGPSGQKMAENTYEKIGGIRKLCEGCIIEADGGVGVDTAPALVEHGANLLVAGSAIFSQSNIKSAIESLQSSHLYRD